MRDYVVAKPAKDYDKSEPTSVYSADMDQFMRIHNQNRKLNWNTIANME